ncbi:MAG: glyoxylate/hydroxypyruvate reductase A [Flammeovirgaceae bacterium]|nr:glyoxylate/hydroxypyruvate reductase A [Flammeovirgaceae bacterium]|tara:strand:- start:229 stop:1152 length:924 start_codon:yes stop_codon:yes gene_type:complete
MAILIDSVSKNLEPWLRAFKTYDHQAEVYCYDDVVDFEKITTAVVWNHRPGLFKLLPNLKLIASLGAGVDHIMNDPYVPPQVSITRIVGKGLSGPMSNFCIGAILHHQRQFDKYLIDKSNRTWDQEPNPERGMNVGIMGMGVLGTDLAKKLTYLGFKVFGFSQSRKKISHVVSYLDSELDLFLSKINILVVMLPATESTRGILSKKLFDKLNKETYLINVARGHHQVDRDIIDAIENKQLSGAFLDVFPEEPLPKQSPFWNHPKIMITPHIAVVTKINEAVPQIMASHNRMMAGELPEILVDRIKGY